MPETPDAPATSVAPPPAARPEVERMPDLGPRYAETPPDPSAAGSRVPAEPYNAATAAVFIVIALYWLSVVWGRWRRFPFVAGCVPVLLAGGIGGTLYHALRTRKAYFLLDVIPIQLLGLAAALVLTARLARGLGWAKVGAVATGVIAASGALNAFVFRTLDLPGNWRVNLSYATLAVIILLPMFVVLLRTRFRHGNWVLLGVMCFAVGWYCRLVDGAGLSSLPMGTHWLWHLFGGGRDAGALGLLLPAGSRRRAARRLV